MPRHDLQSLIAYLGQHSIEEAYSYLGYDYASEAKYGRELKHSGQRDRFISLVDWRIVPTSTLIRRLFNQLNSFYAERVLFDDLEAKPMSILFEFARLTLFKQGKNTGLRTDGIEFGYRIHLDFMDPFRRSKWLYGVGPKHLEGVVTDWCNAVDRCRRDLDGAIALTMILIATHPLSDANGRVGRLFFTWLCERWKLERLWLDEAEDGELLRTGAGVNSTEYLMAMFMKKVAKDHNVIAPGETARQSESESAQMAEALRATLVDLTSNQRDILNTSEFRELRSHLWNDHHFVRTSPRFASLRREIL